MAHVSRLLYHYEGFVSNGTKFEPERSILSGNSVYYEGFGGVPWGRAQQDLRLCVQTHRRRRDLRTPVGNVL